MTASTTTTSHTHPPHYTQSTSHQRHAHDKYTWVCVHTRTHTHTHTHTHSTFWHKNTLNKFKIIYFDMNPFFFKIIDSWHTHWKAQELNQNKKVPFSTQLPWQNHNGWLDVKYQLTFQKTYSIDHLFVLTKSIYSIHKYCTAALFRVTSFQFSQALLVRAAENTFAGSWKRVVGSLGASQDQKTTSPSGKL